MYTYIYSLLYTGVGCGLLRGPGGRFPLAAGRPKQTEAKGAPASVDV